MLEAFKNMYLIRAEVHYAIFAKQFEWKFIDDWY